MFIRNLRNWWKAKTGRDDSPLDGESPWWLFSLFLHVVLLVALGWSFIDTRSQVHVAVELAPPEPETIELAPVVEIDYEEEKPEIGNSDAGDVEAIMQMMPASENLSDLNFEVSQETLEYADYVTEQYEIDMTVDPEGAAMAVPGIAGRATENTEGAIDRITQEILSSLEDNPTLVVWMFDQSASLLKQREEVVRRFDKVYSELGQLQARGAEEFTKHSDVPLLTQVVSFGNNWTRRLPKPTDDLEAIKEAVAGIEVDETGMENVFQAVVYVCREYMNMARLDKTSGKRERNVMVVILSDECGDDIEHIEEAIHLCRKGLIRVFTVGVPAPFGRENTYVKWVDPDPQYDQSVQWAPVRQGPETYLPERINLGFTQRLEEEEAIDSGFGPFGLTRLCWQSGGIYFTVHPNRRAPGERVPQWQTSTYAAFISRFFDSEVMRPYRPDYVSVGEYMNQVKQNKCREALLTAAQQSRLQPMTPPQLRFPKFDEGAFVNSVSVAQRAAAVLEPRIDRLAQILVAGEKDREREYVPRWKAGYDLAIGRVLATQIRAQSYNAMLAMAKTNMQFQNPENNTWVLSPHDSILTGSTAEKIAARARMYLERVVKEHPGTPWAMMAEEELATPIGWKWSEDFTQPPRPPGEMLANNNNNNNFNEPAPPRPEPPQPVLRPPPKL